MLLRFAGHRYMDISDVRRENLHSCRMANRSQVRPLCILRLQISFLRVKWIQYCLTFQQELALQRTGLPLFRRPGHCLFTQAQFVSRCREALHRFQILIEQEAGPEINGTSSFFTLQIIRPNRQEICMRSRGEVPMRT